MRAAIILFFVFNIFTLILSCEFERCPQTLVATPICGYDEESADHLQFSSECDIRNYNCLTGLSYVAISKEQTGCKKMVNTLTVAKWENIFENLPSTECIPERCVQTFAPVPICAYNPNNSVNTYLNFNSECVMRNVNCLYGQNYRAITRQPMTCTQLANILNNFK